MEEISLRGVERKGVSVLGIKKRLKRSPSIIVLNTVLPYHSRSFHWHNSHLHTPSQWRDLHSLSLYHSNYSLLHHYMSREWEHPLGWSWGLPRFTYDMCSASQGEKRPGKVRKSWNQILNLGISLTENEWGLGNSQSFPKSSLCTSIWKLPTSITRQRSTRWLHTACHLVAYV